MKSKRILLAATALMLTLPIANLTTAQAATTLPKSLRGNWTTKAHANAVLATHLIIGKRTFNYDGNKLSTRPVKLEGTKPFKVLTVSKHKSKRGYWTIKAHQSMTSIWHLKRVANRHGKKTLKAYDNEPLVKHNVYYLTAK